MIGLLVISENNVRANVLVLFELEMILICQPDVIVNCAALSVPRACEVDPAAAMSINVPTALVNWMLGFKEKDTLLIHLSTDQGTVEQNFG